jgi:hypothetical protein
VLRMIRAFNAAAAEQRGGWQPSLPLELALAEVLEAPGEAIPAAPVGTKLPPREQPRMQGEKTADKPLAHKEVTVLYQSAPAESAPGGLSLKQMANAWTQVRALVRKQDASLEGLLNTCQLMEIKDGVLVIGFQTDILVEKMGKAEKMALAKKALSEVTGVELDIRCVVTNAKKTVPAEVRADGMVAAAIKHGGEIVDVQE